MGKLSMNLQDSFLNQVRKDGGEVRLTLLDGTEIGLTAPQGTGTDMGVFIADADPSTTTDPLDDDTDNDGLLDGEEDANHNGEVDDGEKDPNDYDLNPSPGIPILLLFN